ncbi:hypothetical protein [Methylorubrum extorquens]
MDPASAAILSYLISVSTHGKTKLFQATIADRTGVGIATVRRRLPLLAHLGLISRVSQYGAKGRAADEFYLNTGCTVRLDHAEREALIRRFNRREAIAAKPSLSPTEPDAVSTTVVLTVSKHSSTGSVLSPFPEYPNGNSGCSELSGFDAAPTAPPAERRPREDFEKARPVERDCPVEGLGELDDFEGSEDMYGGEPDDACEFDLAAPAEPTPSDRAEAIQPASYGDGELPADIHLSPGEKLRARRAWAAGERYTPPQPRPVPAPAPAPAEQPATTAPARRNAGIDRRGVPSHHRGETYRSRPDGRSNHPDFDHEGRIWRSLIPALIALTAQNRLLITRRAIAGRVGALIKEHGAFEASRLIERCLLEGPTGDPLDYIAGAIRLDQRRRHSIIEYR